ncbi:MAG: hypothetical protein WBL23_15930 [Salinisphaera sp.]|uniref:hypothetical protein n=1 Tax=Salinisphaera sp. TaxID=1914330 RepID=UPI003C79CF6B
MIPDLNFAIDAALRTHDVTIAFPQMDVWHGSAAPLAAHARVGLQQRGPGHGIVCKLNASWGNPTGSAR